MPAFANRFFANEHSYVVAPNDGADLPGSISQLYVGGTGDVTYDPADGSTTALLLKAVPIGTVLRVGMKRIRATGTTATQLVGSY